MASRYESNSNVSDDEMDVGYDSDEAEGVRVDEDIFIPPPPRILGANDASAPRLMIKKIHNTNFKSYANEQIIGPFHKCFSSIIGPNGSGKSNVIDSMLFVFGYRASKIRSKKIATLIHNSSEHPAANSCTVSVHFHKIIDKPGHDYDVVPESEFVISRTAFKDNSSYYEYNSKKVQFKEIATALRSHGVDLDHNRFLILQGEVEQIALMKPKGQNEHETGMVEFLEDIIGTVRFKEPLDKLSTKVEALNEVRMEKLNRLRIVEKEKEALAGPMEEVVEYLKIENSIVELQHQLYQCKRSEAMRDLAGHEEKRKDLDNDCNALVEEIKVLKERQDEKSEELKEKSTTWEKLESKKNKLNQEFEKIRKQDESLHAETTQTKKRRKNNCNLIETEKHKLEELKTIPEANEEQIEIHESELEDQTKTLETEKSTLTTMMSGLKEKTAPLVSQRTILEKKLLEIRRGVDKRKTIYDVAKSNLELYTSIEQTERNKLQNLQETYQKNTETLNQRKEQLKTLDKKIPATEKSLKEIGKELETGKKEKSELDDKLKNLRGSYEEKRNNMQANKSRNRVHGVLLEEKRTGRIPGILGRLGDLGAIEAKYDVAVSTACGALDNIVVDTVSAAESCINHLRATNVGRSTFIPLEKHQRFLAKCSERIKTPENVPRLFDLIKVAESRVLPAFYYALQDTLVAEDLDQATRVAYGARRYRVVTLKGELIEMSGTMSGGGRAIQGRMGQRVFVEDNPIELDELQSKLDSIYQRCQSVGEKLQNLENQEDSLSQALNDMITDRSKFRIEVKMLEEQEPSLKRQISEQKKKIEETLSNPKEIERLENVMREARIEYESVEKDSSIVEKDIALVGKEIDEISGSRLKGQQKVIDRLNKTIDELRQNICKLQVAIKTAARDGKKIVQRIETLQTTIEKDEKRLEEIEKEKLELESVGKIVMEKLETIENDLKGEDGVVGELRKELNELNKREAKLKALKIDLDERVRDSDRALNEMKIVVPELTRKIVNSKLQYIPGENDRELVEMTAEEIDELDPAVVVGNLKKAKSRLPSQKPNLQIIEDYRTKDELYLKRFKDLELITNERNRIREIFDSTRRQRTQEFIAGFDIITGRLKEMYQMITLGGDAELELVDTLDPFTEGIIFSVRPPKKSWKNISNLSGGEKTLSSLALVFALHHYKPTPLYFMDEIDAALDFKNVSIVGNYIKERTKNAQFIVVSLRSNMFELADVLVGIYKTYNCTKSVTLDVDKFCQEHDISMPAIDNNRRSVQNTQQSKSTCPMSFPSLSQGVPNELTGGLEATASTSNENLLGRNMLPKVVLVPLSPTLLAKSTRRSPKVDQEQRRRSPRVMSTSNNESDGPNQKKRKIK